MIYIVIPAFFFNFISFSNFSFSFSSYIKSFDDEDSNNSNTASGNLPDGIYDNDTKIYYCKYSSSSCNCLFESFLSLIIFFCFLPKKKNPINIFSTLPSNPTSSGRKTSNRCNYFLESKFWK